MMRLFDMDDHTRLPWRFFASGLQAAQAA